MNPPRYRAWRFVHPDFDIAENETGLRVSASGAIETVDEAASVRQAILMLLTTRPGERVMRPEYGTELHRLVFSPNDNTTAGLAIHYVKRTLARWEPRIDVLRVDAGANTAIATQLDIVVEYRLRPTRQVERITVSMNLAGESF
jgi:phage baseplate assembly protein W